MIGPGDFTAAAPARVAGQLGGAVHLWRLPYARGMGRQPLLALLAAYLDGDPGPLELRDDEHGKPYLFVRGEADRTLQFNWSHSGDLAVVALARDVTPGVDIEQVREGVKSLDIAQRFFAPDEAQALAACGEGERDALFFGLWCAKEAVLKAVGRGLAFGLERVAFASRGGHWRPARFDEGAGDPADWQVHAFSPGSGYAGALAWSGPPQAVLPFRMAGD